MTVLVRILFQVTKLHPLLSSGLRLVLPNPGRSISFLPVCWCPISPPLQKTPIYKKNRNQDICTSRKSPVDEVRSGCNSGKVLFFKKRRFLLIQILWNVTPLRSQTNDLPFFSFAVWYSRYWYHIRNHQFRQRHANFWTRCVVFVPRVLFLITNYTTKTVTPYFVEDLLFSQRGKLSTCTLHAFGENEIEKHMIHGTR